MPQRREGRVLATENFEIKQIVVHTHHADTRGVADLSSGLGAMRAPSGSLAPETPCWGILQVPGTSSRTGVAFWGCEQWRWAREGGRWGN